MFTITFFHLSKNQFNASTIFRRENIPNPISAAAEPTERAYDAFSDPQFNRVGPETW